MLPGRSPGFRGWTEERLTQGVAGMTTGKLCDPSENADYPPYFIGLLRKNNYVKTSEIKFLPYSKPLINISCCLYCIHSIDKKIVMPKVLCKIPLIVANQEFQGVPTAQ